MDKNLLVIVILAGYIQSCTLADSKRCSSGFEWDGDLKACLRPENDTDISSIPLFLDGGADGDVERPVGDIPTGYLEECEVSGDCSSYEATFCLINPQDGQGACMVENCTPGGCPADSTCCDCTTIAFPVFCVPNEALEALGQYCDCSI